MSAVIDCRDLVRIFTGDGVEVQALQGLTLQVAAGELTAIVGASGSGKSTLLNILSGADAPTAGRAVVDGHDLASMGRAERVRYRRETVGFVFQQAERNLLGYLTAAENIALALSAAGSPRSARAGRVDQMLELLALTRLRDRLPGRLSGGERQRVAIAVGLANAPRVLLADEPTGELDEAASAAVLELLRSINEATGVTVLIVTHDETVSGHVRRTVQIRDGRTATETHRAGIVDAVPIAREYAVLDRAGRLQLPHDYVRQLSLRDLVRLELESDHVEVRPAESGPDEV